MSGIESNPLSRSASLPGLGGNVAIMHLVEHLNDPDRQVRERALFELAKLGDDRAFDGLLEMMQKERNLRSRDRAIRALGLLGDVRAAYPLMEFVLGSHYIQASEQAAAIALKRICKASPEVLDDVISRLLVSLPDDHRAGGAALMLGEIGDPRAVEPLIGSLASTHFYVWRYSVYALSVIGKKHADFAPYILDTLLKHNLAQSRGVDALRYLVEAITIIGLQHENLAGQVVDALAERHLGLNPPQGYYHYHWRAAQALGELGSQHASVRQPVIDALSAAALKRPGTHDAALALAEIDDEHATEVLLQAFRVCKRDQQECFAIALAKRGLIEPLVEMLPLGRHLPGLRRAAVDGLGASGDLRAAGPLIGVLSSSDSITRRKAAKALGMLRSHQAVQPLIEALSDGRKEVRRSAAEALGKIEKAHPGVAIPAVPALISLLDDKTRSVQETAGKALERFQVAEAQEAVWRWRFPDV